MLLTASGRTCSIKLNGITLSSQLITEHLSFVIFDANKNSYLSQHKSQ